MCIRVHTSLVHRKTPTFLSRRALCLPPCQCSWPVFINITPEISTLPLFSPSPLEKVCVTENVSTVTLAEFHVPASISGQLNASKLQMLSKHIYLYFPSDHMPSCWPWLSFSLAPKRRWLHLQTLDLPRTTHASLSSPPRSPASPPRGSCGLSQDRGLITGRLPLHVDTGPHPGRKLGLFPFFIT